MEEDSLKSATNCLVSKSFNPDSVNQNQLFVDAYPDFQGRENRFIIVNKSTGIIVATGFLDNENSSTVLKHTFNDVVLFNGDHRYTIVPSAHFENGQEADFLKIVGFSEDIKPMSNVISKQGIVICYFASETKLVTQNSVQIQHPAFNFIKYVLDREENNTLSKQSLHVLIQKNHVHIMEVKDQLLQFHNIYESQTIEDACYYILFCFDRKNLNAEETPITLWGESELVSEIRELLSLYLGRIKTSQPDCLWKWDRELTGSAELSYQLKTSWLCV